MIIVVCGVSGSGKSTIGKLLADQLGVAFYDADDFHPQSNKEKMASGQALNDEDRAPWLDILASNFPKWTQQGGAVLACSALKEIYREKLSSYCHSGEKIHWVMLTASKSLLTERLANRKGHFFDSRLLSSQLKDLELPAYGIYVDVSESPDKTVESIMAGLPEDNVEDRRG